MTGLDNKIVQEMKQDIVDSVFSDDIGPFIDSLADLETDKDIIDKCSGGKCDE